MKEETMNKIKNGLIGFLLILIVLFAFFGGKKVTKYAEEIGLLKYSNTSLETQKAFLETQIKVVQRKVEQRDRVIDSYMIEFKKKDRVIAGITSDLDAALAKLNGITSDSSYQFLQQIAYNYPGILKYLFNELQIRHIHTDYIKARNSEKIIPAYVEQVANCTFQLSERDSIEIGLKKAIRYQREALTACETVNNNKDTIIKDTEKQRDKEKHRKNFWRFGASVSAGVAIVLALFVL